MLDSLCIQHQDASAEQSDILNNIYWLLNTRQGTLQHMPELGLVDFAAYSNDDEGRRDYVREIKELICRFEPRIHQLMVRICDVDQSDCLLKLEFTAKTCQENPLYFSSILLMNGEILVK